MCSSDFILFYIFFEIFEARKVLKWTLEWLLGKFSKDHTISSEIVKVHTKTERNIHFLICHTAIGQFDFRSTRAVTTSWENFTFTRKHALTNPRLPKVNQVEI